MHRALVIGGGGFIGTHLCSHLCRQDWEVNVIDCDPSDEFYQIRSPFLRYSKIDLHDDTDLVAKVRESSVIFHLAAQPSVEICESDPAQSTRANFRITVELVEALRKVSCDEQSRMLVFTSTSAVYGDPKTRSPISENEVTAPLSNYGKDKLRSEETIIRGSHSSAFPFRYCILRLFNVYGCGQKMNSPYSGVIARFLDALRASEALNIHGSGEQVRDFVHVRDVVRALLAAAESTGFDSPLNVATGVGTSVNQLAELVRKPKSLMVHRLEPRKNDVFFSIGDPSRISSLLNWTFSIPIEEGIEELMNRAEKHPCGA